jgi:hypothetical protein
MLEEVVDAVREACSMRDDTVVTSVAEWRALPAVVPAVVKNAESQGLVLEVEKIGFLRVPLVLCDELGLTAADTVGSGECPLPTALVRTESGDRTLHRLPLELASWAFDSVALAHATGIRWLPSRIEFGVLDGRCYAQLL